MGNFSYGVFEEKFIVCCMKVSVWNLLFKIVFYL